MSLAGCGVIIYADVCKNSKIDPCNVEVEVEAEKSPNGGYHEGQRKVECQKVAGGSSLETNRGKLPSAVHLQGNRPS